jgi:DNA-binding response OmpR family regulator
VLCVDDEPDVSEMIRAHLESAGYEAITANGGGPALDLFDGRRPDVVLLDVNMPGRSGIEVLEALLERDPDVAVIMLTAIGDVRTGVGAVSSGAFDYIVKPAPMEEVLASVQRALEKRRLVLENRDYRKNMEEKVAEQTRHLQQRIRELNALNDLFQKHISRTQHMETAYRQLIAGVTKTAEQLRSLAVAADAGPVRVSCDTLFSRSVLAQRGLPRTAANAPSKSPSLTLPHRDEDKALSERGDLTFPVTSLGECQMGAKPLPLTLDACLTKQRARYGRLGLGLEVHTGYSNGPFRCCRFSRCSLRTSPPARLG